MGFLQLRQDQRPDEETAEVATRLRQTDARFSELLDDCVGALGENALAARQLSDRLSFLRKEIESHAVARRPEDEETRS